MIKRAFCLVCAIALAACGESGTSAPADAERMADVLSGDSAGAANDNPVCKLFTADELAEYAGEPLADPSNAAMGSGCQWLAEDDSGDVLIQIVPKDYHQNPSLAEGYRELPDIGIEGNVSPAFDGWLACAISGEEAIAASVAGKSASADTAAALLREVIKRRGG